GEGTAAWIYDLEPGGIGKLAAMISAPDPRLTQPCTVAHARGLAGNRVGRSFRYTRFGEVAEVTDCAEGTSFLTSYTYDSIGRQSLIQYPEVNGKRLAVGYHHTSVGYLNYLTDVSGDGSVLWQAKTMNAFDQVIDDQTGNGVENISVRN